MYLQLLHYKRVAAFLERDCQADSAAYHPLWNFFHRQASLNLPRQAAPSPSVRPLRPHSQGPVQSHTLRYTSYPPLKIHTFPHMFGKIETYACYWK